MKSEKSLRFYLEPGLKKSAEKGAHNFIGKMEKVARASGFDVAFCEDTPDQRAASEHLPGYSVFHMHEPFHARSLTIRRAYYYPFWQIEQSAKRWEWRVARAVFDGTPIDRATAEGFFNFWRKRLFGLTGQGVGAKGFVYVPLQGRLDEHRSFQTCSPVRMIETVLEQEPERAVIATLHPNETYTPKELDILNRLANNQPRLGIQTGNMEALLAGCEYVVTQNSSAAFAALFYRKPSITFAEIDFHHITAHVPRLGVAGAFQHLHQAEPDYAGYVWWFLQQMAINAGRPEAERKIHDVLLQAGWPM